MVPFLLQLQLALMLVTFLARSGSGGCQLASHSGWSKVTDPPVCVPLTLPTPSSLYEIPPIPPGEDPSASCLPLTHAFSSPQSLSPTRLDFASKHSSSPSIA